LQWQAIITAAAKLTNAANDVADYYVGQWFRKPASK